MKTPPFFSKKKYKTVKNETIAYSAFPKEPLVLKINKNWYYTERNSEVGIGRRQSLLLSHVRYIPLGLCDEILAIQAIYFLIFTVYMDMMNLTKRPRER